MPFLLIIVSALLPLGLGFALWHRTSLKEGTPVSRAIYVAIAAAALGLCCQLAERALLSWTGLSLSADGEPLAEGLLSTFVFTAPLEEGAKVLALWPLYRARSLQFPRQGIVLAAASAMGFAAAESAWHLASGTQDLLFVRATLAVPTHFLCAILWGATLGARSPGAWFSLAWFVAMLLHGLSDHFAFHRGAGVIVLVLPLLLTQAALAYAMARKATTHQAQVESALDDLDEALLEDWAEPASVREVWAALKPQTQRLLVPWIAASALVTTGTTLAMLAASLYAGHAMGLDFSLADEANVRSNGPLLLLATAIGTAFPIAGYLVARASGTKSVLEPALGAALAVLATVLLLSFTTPVAAVFALALAPVGFVLASSGAWFGLAS